MAGGADVGVEADGPQARVTRRNRLQPRREPAQVVDHVPPLLAGEERRERGHPPETLRDGDEDLALGQRGGHDLEIGRLRRGEGGPHAARRVGAGLAVTQTAEGRVQFLARRGGFRRRGHRVRRQTEGGDVVPPLQRHGCIGRRAPWRGHVAHGRLVVEFVADVDPAALEDLQPDDHEDRQHHEGHHDPQRAGGPTARWAAGLAAVHHGDLGRPLLDHRHQRPSHAVEDAATTRRDPRWSAAEIIGRRPRRGRSVRRRVRPGPRAPARARGREARRPPRGSRGRAARARTVEFPAGYASCR